MLAQLLVVVGCMKKAALVSAIVVAGLLAGCTRKAATDKPEPRGWFIESYNNGVVTVQHEGNTYKARCDISRSFNNASSATDPNNVHMFSTCDLVIGFVGRNVQPFEGKQKDASGWTINMWNAGSTLLLRSWRDEHAPWRQDEFVITSVANTGGNQ
jgi:hypothetical protein